MGRARARALGWLREWTLDWVGWSSLCLSSPARGFKQTYTKPKRKRDATVDMMTGHGGGATARTGSKATTGLGRRCVCCSVLTARLEKEKKICIVDR